MVDFQFLKNPTTEQTRQIARLYRKAHWWPDAEAHGDMILRLVAGSHCFLAAVSDDRIIGMGRAISDGASDAYVQDVTVDEAFRRQGIGGRIVTAIVSRLKADGLTWIGLIAERGTRALYEPIGFAPMPQDALPMLLTIP